MLSITSAQQDSKSQSLYFLLIILLTMLVASTLSPEHQANLAEKIGFGIGMAIFLGGTCWRLVQRWKKSDTKWSSRVQAYGVVVTCLVTLSGVII